MISIVLFICCVAERKDLSVTSHLSLVSLGKDRGLEGVIGKTEGGKQGGDGNNPCWKLKCEWSTRRHHKGPRRSAQTNSSATLATITCKQLVYSLCTVSMVNAAVASRINRITKSYVHACKCTCCKIEPSHRELLREDRGQCVRGV